MSRSLRVHELVAAAFRERPDAVALIADGASHSYSRLAAEIQACRDSLVRAGAVPGSRVAVQLSHGAEVVTALLACWEAGAVYVPIDAEVPAARARALLEAAAPAVVIREAAGDEPPGAPGQVIRTDSGWQATGPTTPGGAVPGEPGNSGSPAYLLHTSGSTGRPRGVLVSHAALAQHLLALADQLGATATDRFLVKAPVSFDVSLREMLLPLVTGGTAVIAPTGGHRDPRALVSVVESRQVTMASFVPAVLRLFLDEVAPGGCRSLRLVTSGGEPLDPVLAADFHRRLDVRLVNVYGPTETTISVTGWEVRRAADAAEPLAPMLIGTALPGVELHVLDAELRPVGPDVIGELYVGGGQLAAGYWQAPGLTAAHFVASPTGGPGRLYRTGDLVRGDPRTGLEFVGRYDDQVKIHGVRIETGEVAAHLRAVPGVHDGAVVACRVAAGEPYLAAFVAPEPGAADDATLAERCRSLLSQRLPRTLVPARVTVLNRLPVTRHGKVDRATLTSLARQAGDAVPAVSVAGLDAPAVSAADPDGPAVSAAGPGAPADPAAPAGADLSQTVLRLAAEVLGVAVTAADDFFALGGSSLSAVRFTRALAEAFDVPFKLKMLLGEPQLAAVIARVGTLLEQSDGSR